MAVCGHSGAKTTMTNSFSRPLRSRATRKPAARSKVSSRGHVIGLTIADPVQRMRYYESKREQDGLFLLHARADVVDIWDQPPAVPYHDANGKTRTHTFDFLVTLRDGRRIAIAIKPAAIVEQRSFRNTLRLIRAATPLSFATEVVLITEQSYCPSAARNAQKLHDFRRTADREADQAIAALIRGLSGPTTLAELAQKSGLGGRAFRAAFRAIYAGMLRTLDVGDILPATRVVPEVAQ